MEFHGYELAYIRSSERFLIEIRQRDVVKEFNV
jgi:hypothetical protein